MLDLPPEPVRNTPITAEWGRKVVRALRALCPVAGAGMAVDVTPNGTTYRLAAPPAPKRSSALELRPWQPKLILEAFSSGSSGGPIYRLAMTTGKIVYQTAEGETTFPEIEHQEADIGKFERSCFQIPNNVLTETTLYLVCDRSGEAPRWTFELAAANKPLAEPDAAGVLRFRRKAIAEIDLSKNTLTPLIHGSRLEVADPAAKGGGQGADGDTYTPEVYEGTTTDTAGAKSAHLKFTNENDATDIKDFSSINLKGAAYVPSRFVRGGGGSSGLEEGVYYIYFKNSQTGAELGPIAVGKLDGKDGADGEDGKDATNGKDGVSVSSVTTQAVAASSGTPAGTKVTITLSNGTSKTFTIYNGKNGADGADGEDGADATLPAAQSLTVVTAVSYNTTTHKLTYKKRTVTGYFTSISDESAAINVFTATPHSEEHS